MEDLANLVVENATDLSARNATLMAETGSPFSFAELQLTLIILLFGLISSGIFYMLVRSGKATNFLMRIYVINILVFGSLLVVSSGFGTDQIAPVIGFFGTIAGYLLGRSERTHEKSE